jgi:HD-GYP domain-containing protein (c-di-GMP phosphodiesterase class II)
MPHGFAASGRWINVNSRATIVVRSLDTWVLVGAVVAAFASIVVVTTLQSRAMASRASQVTLEQVRSEFNALQSLPYDVMDAPTATRASIQGGLRAGELSIEHKLATLRRRAPTPHQRSVTVPFEANMASLERIRGLLVAGHSREAKALGLVAARQQRAVGHGLDRAGDDYSQRATRAHVLARVGSAATILILVGLFGVFYVRSRRAHARSERLADANQQLLVEDSQLQVIQRLAIAAEYRDDETGEHTRRVADLAAPIGEALGMSEEQVRLLRQAAPLHDVGKIGIPDSILLKPGRLTAKEFAEMKRHTTLGAGMLAGGRGALMEMAEAIALAHHERWDGSGYPHGLKGEAIPLAGRVVAVADVVDALTHARPYKQAWPLEDAVREIAAQAGRQFDPAAVDAFLRLLPDLPLPDASHEPWLGDEHAVPVPEIRHAPVPHATPNAPSPVDAVVIPEEVVGSTPIAVKRLRIEIELRERPNDSDRAIAHTVGCDPRTVAATRRRLGLGRSA